MTTSTFAYPTPPAMSLLTDNCSEEDSTMLLGLPHHVLIEIIMLIAARDLPSVHLSCRTLTKLVREERCFSLTFQVPHPCQRPGPLPRLLNFPRVSTLCLNSVQPPALFIRRRLATPAAAAAAATAAVAAGRDNTSPRVTPAEVPGADTQAASYIPTSAISGPHSANVLTERQDRATDSGSLQESLLLSWVRLNRREMARQIVTLDLKLWRPDLTAAAFEVLVTSCVRLQVLHGNHVPQGGAFQQASLELAQQQQLQQNLPEAAPPTTSGDNVNSSSNMIVAQARGGSRPSNMHFLTACREVRSCTVSSSSSVSPGYLTQLVASWPQLAYLSLSRSQGVTLGMLRPLLALAPSLVALRLGWLEDEEDEETEPLAPAAVHPGPQQAVASASAVMTAPPAAASDEHASSTEAPLSDSAQTAVSVSGLMPASAGESGCSSIANSALKSPEIARFPEGMSSLRFLALEETEVTVQLAGRIRGVTSLRTLHVAGGYIPKRALEVLCCPQSPPPLSPMFANLSLLQSQPGLFNFPHPSQLSALFLDSLDATDATWCMLADLKQLRVLQLGRLALSSSSSGASGSSSRTTSDPGPISLFDSVPRHLPSLEAVEAFAVNHKLALSEGRLCVLLPALRCCRVEEAGDVIALVGHPTLQHLRVSQLKLQPGDTVPPPTNQLRIHETGRSSTSTGNADVDAPSSTFDESPSTFTAAAATSASALTVPAVPNNSSSSRSSSSNSGYSNTREVSLTTPAALGAKPVSGWSLLLSRLSSVPQLTSLSITATHIDSSTHHLSTPPPPSTPASILAQAPAASTLTPQSAASTQTHEPQHTAPLLPSLLWLHLCVRGHMPDPSFGALLGHCPLLRQLQLQLREPGARVDGWSAAVCAHPCLRRIALMWMRLHVSSVETLLVSGRLDALHMAACAFDFAAYRQVLSAVSGAARTSLTWETGYDVWEPPHPAFFPNPKTVQSHVTEAAGNAVRYGPYDM